MNSSQGFPRLALFLCGCAAFLNLYTTQGIFDELAASFHISAHQSNWSITATTLRWPSPRPSSADSAAAASAAG